MRVVIQPATDPYFNLAAEEYLLAHEDEDVFLLWRNAPVVVIGRNQNAWAEVDLPYVEENGIAVVRRLSGGGAVFHDLGNVNFTFLTARTAGGIDFGRFTAPIIDALAELGVAAVPDGRNDLAVGTPEGPAKISGNAQAVWRRPDGAERLLHHGTILLSADLTHLAAALRVRPEKLRARGIASVRRRVTNLADLPGFPPMTPEAFVAHLAAHAGRRPDAVRRPLTAEETAGIERLREEKYATWEWNWGASGSMEAERYARFPFGGVSAALEAAHGRVTKVRFWGDYFGIADVAEAEAALVGVPLTSAALEAALSSLPRPLTDYMQGATPAALAALLTGGGQAAVPPADRAHNLS